MRTLVFSLMVLALLHAFKPYFSESQAQAPTREEVEALSLKTKMITSDGVAKRLKAADRSTMVVIYASWCQYCRKVMPVVQELWAEGKVVSDQILFISLDQHVSKLSEYLLENNLAAMIGTPIMLKVDKERPLSHALKPLYSGYTGSIPYIGFFAADGSLIDEINGQAPKAQLEAALKTLK